MKIKIEIPDFVPPERIIYIMAGIEKIGYIEPHTRKVFVKVSRCSQCGRCCDALKCQRMEKESGNNNKWLCSCHAMRPFSCCISDSRNIPECTVQYKEL